MQFIIVPSSCPNRRPPAPQPPRACTHLLSHPHPFIPNKSRPPSPSVAAPHHNGPNLPPFLSLWFEHWGRGPSPLSATDLFLRLLGVFSSDSFSFSIILPFRYRFFPVFWLRQRGGLDLRPPGGTLPLDSSWLSVLVSRDLVDSARTWRGEEGIASKSSKAGTRKSSHFKSDLSPAWRANSRK